MKALLLTLVAGIAAAQVPSAKQVQSGEMAPSASNAGTRSFDGLALSQKDMLDLRLELSRKNYGAAQGILLRALGETQENSRRGPLLLALGSIYFVAHDPLQAATAWQKAGALEALPKDVRFSLAMAYIQIGHSDWATSQLTALSMDDPQQALYPFWLGRLAYDAQHYSEAAERFRTAVSREPGFSRAHDNLGLCLFALNDVDGAVVEYRRAIDLQALALVKSGWPFLNLGIAQEFQGKLADAATSFKTATELDPKFAQAHYRLGNVLVSLDRLPDATKELETAARLEPEYPEPHAVLARVYRRGNDGERARAEAARYRQLLQQKEAGHPGQGTPLENGAKR